MSPVVTVNLSPISSYHVVATTMGEKNKREQSMFLFLESFCDNHSQLSVRYLLDVKIYT